MIRNKIIVIQVGVIVLTISALIVMGNLLGTAIEERDQAVSFTLAKDDTIQYLTTKNGQISAQTHVQELTIRNMRRLQSDERLSWIRNFEGINKRMSNLESATRTTAVAVANFKIPLGDTTIIMPDSTKVHARTFDNHNEWYRIKGFVAGDTLVTTPEVTVPLESVIYLGKRTKKILFFRVGPREVLSETTSPNPFVKITKSEVIRVTKRK